MGGGGDTSYNRKAGCSSYILGVEIGDLVYLGFSSASSRARCF